MCRLSSVEVALYGIVAGRGVVQEGVDKCNFNFGDRNQT